jgi:hypothetical protein
MRFRRPWNAALTMSPPRRPRLADPGSTLAGEHRARVGDRLVHRPAVSPPTGEITQLGYRPTTRPCAVGCTRSAALPAPGTATEAGPQPCAATTAGAGPRVLPDAPLLLRIGGQGPARKPGVRPRAARRPIRKHAPLGGRGAGFARRIAGPMNGAPRGRIPQAWPRLRSVIRVLVSPRESKLYVVSIGNGPADVRITTRSPGTSSTI